MTTTEVCEQCLLAATACESSSYCDMLKRRGSDGVGVATVFISHAWKYSFADVVNALEYHFRDTPDIYIWFDLFSNNQHAAGAAGNLPFEWWATTFKSAIAQFRRVVMILSPWNDPIPFTLAWCLFEVYSAVSTNSTFEVAMSKSDFRSFLQSIMYDAGSFLKMLATIDLLKCEAFNPVDKDRIFEVVKSEVGFSNLNGMVKAKMREWVDATLSSRTGALDGNVSVKSLDENAAYARTLHDTGQYEKALEIYQQCLNGYIDLGTSPDNVYNGLGKVCEMLGRYEEAMEYNQQALDIRMETFGERHADVASSYNNMGNVCDLMGQYEEAMEYHKKALDIRIETLGEGHADVASSYNNIGNICDVLGQYEEAMEYYEKSIDIRIKSLGARHIEVAGSYNNIGNICDMLGQYEEAMKYHKKALDIRIETFGERHVEVSDSYTNMGSVCEILGRYQEAMEYHRKSLAIGLESLGDRHPDVADSYSNIGTICETLGQYDEAMEYYKRALDIRVQSLGELHSSVSNSYSDFGVIYQKLGRYEEAMEYYKKSLDIAIESLGEAHPDVINTNVNMAHLLVEMGDYTECECLLKQALDAISDDSTELHYLHFVYGDMYMYQGSNPSEATRYYQLSLDARTDLYGYESSHVEIADCLYGLGMVCVSIGSYDEALSYLSQSLDMRLKLLPARHPDVARSYYGLGVMYYRQDDMMDEACDNLHKTLDIQMSILGENHKHTIDTRECLNNCRSNKY
jgi:tetratricopeptide (TPR) repeat protein